MIKDSHSSSSSSPSSFYSPIIGWFFECGFPLASVSSAATLDSMLCRSTETILSIINFHIIRIISFSHNFILSYSLFRFVPLFCYFLCLDWKIDFPHQFLLNESLLFSVHELFFFVTIHGFLFILWGKFCNENCLKLLLFFS